MLNDIHKFRSSLRSLCIGKYQRNDVFHIVDTFCNSMKQIIISQLKSGKFFLPSNSNSTRLIDDIAIDFLAHKFDMDGMSRFISLNKYFSVFLDRDDNELNTAYQKFLQITFQQSKKNLFAQEDKLGAKFYESLKYILRKHPEWEKSKKKSGTTIISEKGGASDTIDELDLRNFVSNKQIHNKRMTSFLEDILKNIINNCGQAVHINILHRLVHEYYSFSGNVHINFDTLSPEKQLLLDESISETTKEIDNSVLLKYLNTGKINRDEYNNFNTAVRNFIIDLINGQDGQSLHIYLNDAMENELTVEKYRQIYRTRFEYLIRQTRKILSAKLINDSIY